MIIVKLQGRLGNQLFCYAFAKKLSSLGKEVALDCELLKRAGNECELEIFPNIDLKAQKEIRTASLQEIYQLGDFNRSFIDKARRKILGVKKTYKKELFNGYDESFLLEENAYLEGYWQTEKYFKDIEEEIRKAFIFPDFEKKDYTNQKMKEEMKKHTSISIHIRRGDYLNENNKGIFAGICTAEYYENAINYFKNKYENVMFYVFSDDINWAKKHYNNQKEFRIVEGNEGKKSYCDMQLMSLCNHNIIANSSFSWWAAWLNSHQDKEIIAPKKWFHNDLTPDIWCEGWIKM